MSKKKKPVQCEGWRRTGIFQMGGTGRWEQCKENAVVMLTVEQEWEKTKTLPSCAYCWKEARETEEIEILETKPL